MKSLSQLLLPVFFVTGCASQLNVSELPPIAYQPAKSLQSGDLVIEHHKAHFQDLSLSPSGNTLAYIRPGKEKYSKELMLNSMSGGEGEVLLPIRANQTLRWFKWANDNTLIISLTQDSLSASKQLIRKTQMLVMNTTNKEANALLPKHVEDHSQGLTNEYQEEFVDLLTDEPNHILVAASIDTSASPTVYKVDLTNQRRTKVERAKSNIQHWMADRQGEIKLGIAIDPNSQNHKVFTRIEVTNEWRTLFEFNPVTDPEASISPVGFGDNSNILYYKKYHQAKVALFKVNLSTQQHEVVLADPTRDINGDLVYSDKLDTLVGIYASDVKGPNTYWAGEYDRLQQQLDEAIPNRQNTIVNMSLNENKYLVYSRASKNKGTYYLGDRTTNKLSKLFHDS